MTSNNKKFLKKKGKKKETCESDTLGKSLIAITMAVSPHYLLAIVEGAADQSINGNRSYQW